MNTSVLVRRGRSSGFFAASALSIVCLGAVVGCKNQNNGTGASMSGRGTAFDVSSAPVSPLAAAAAPAPQAYAPAPAPAAVAQPVVYDSVPAGSGATPAAPVSASTSGAPSGTGTAASSSAAGGSYTVKKGDTLYSIAKAHYGSGKEYGKIVSANPGLSAGTLKVGQKIALP